MLQRLGVRATFYVPILLSDVCANPGPWRAMAAAGHELGNHSLFHPCRQRDDEPLEWLDQGLDLATYTPRRLHAELEVANRVLAMVDGEASRSYGNTCSDTAIGSGAERQPMAPVLRDLFVGARGALTNRVADPRTTDLFDVGCFNGDGRTFTELTDIVEMAEREAAWAVVMFHGVGPEHALHVEEDVHDRFVTWLAERRDRTWTAPFATVAAQLRAVRRSSA